MKNNSMANIYCCKISNKINMAKLSTYFNVHINKDYVQLDSLTISSIIKVQSNDKLLIIFEYGCIAFVNFLENEIRQAFILLENILGPINYAQHNQFNETLTLSIDNDNVLYVNSIPFTIKYNEYILQICCSVISKSVALSFLENEIIYVLDDVESIVSLLQKAHLRTNTKKFFSHVAHMARFQHSAIKSLGLFDSILSYNKNSDCNHFYKKLLHYYEIEERTSVLESKIDEVNKIISTYSNLSYIRQELRLLIFESVLLSMFLLPHFIDFEDIIMKLFNGLLH